MESKLDDSPHAIRGTFSAFYWASNFSETREKVLFLTISINFFFFNYFHLNYGNEFFHLVLETNIQLTANILACVANYSNALWQFILCSALCYAIRILLRYCFIDAFHEVYFCWKISTKISKSWIFYFLRGRRGGRGGGVETTFWSLLRMTKIVLGMEARFWKPFLNLTSSQCVGFFFN